MNQSIHSLKNVRGINTLYVVFCDNNVITQSIIIERLKEDQSKFILRVTVIEICEGVLL